MASHRRPASLAQPVPSLVMAKINTATLINSVTTDGKILKIKRQYMTMKTAATMQFH